MKKFLATCLSILMIAGACIGFTGCDEDYPEYGTYDYYYMKYQEALAVPPCSDPDPEIAARIDQLNAEYTQRCYENLMNCTE